MAEIYPKFISNHAIGYDLYEGKSQGKSPLARMAVPI